ncbi:hypothetical protein [Rouxiella sp. WC2420]|uniref:Uncharacterized protein n=1 Tax=Rouxiella sp. WC2420 TaxID=3234145 RepID=A0AB39VYR5_9GAMM
MEVLIILHLWRYHGVGCLQPPDSLINFSSSGLAQLPPGDNANDIG